MIWAILAQSWCGAFEARLPAAAVEGRGGPSTVWVSTADPLEANPALQAVAPPGGELGAGGTRPFGLDDLASGGFWTRWGSSRGWAVGGRWRSLGAGGIYREDAWAADLAWRTGRWSWGGGMRVGHVSLEGESLGTPLGAAAGVHAKLEGGLQVAASWEDGSILRSQGLPEPWVLGCGLGLSGLDSSWTADLSVQRREAWGWSGKVGQELRLEPLRLRAGLRAHPWTISVGLGGGVGPARLDWALEGDSFLGWQHQVSAAWTF